MNPLPETIKTVCVRDLVQDKAYRYEGTHTVIFPFGSAQQTTMQIRGKPVKGWYSTIDEPVGHRVSLAAVMPGEICWMETAPALWTPVRVEE